MDAAGVGCGVGDGGDEYGVRLVLLIKRGQRVYMHDAAFSGVFLLGSVGEFGIREVTMIRLDRNGRTAERSIWAKTTLAEEGIVRYRSPQERGYGVDV